MAKVEVTRHLYAFFPSLEGRELDVPGANVAEVLRGMEALAPPARRSHRRGIDAYIAASLERKIRRKTPATRRPPHTGRRGPTRA